jgi:ribose transport system ATP-binding protein
VRFPDPAAARARRIEMVYQDLSLCDTIDVAGNLSAREMLASLRIRVPDLSASVSSLSGGQRQSVAIARAASFDPLVLIMDEPTSALAVVEAVLDLIRHVKARGVAVVLITHRLQDLFRVCDRIVVMYEGIKVAERRIAETSLEDLVSLIVGSGGA